MGTVYSPDIDRRLMADLYTHVRTFPDPEQPTEWSEPKLEEIVVGQTFFINDYVATFQKMQRVENVEGLLLGENDVAVKAIIEIQGEFENYTAEPMYIIKDQMAGKIPIEVKDIAARISVNSIQPENNSFTFEISTTQKDWIIMEAVEKPYINVLWIGTFLVMIGLFVAILRRYDEFIISRDKAMEV
jgi:cytochrome c-type biogenesis protein CcmF